MPTESLSKLCLQATRRILTSTGYASKTIQTAQGTVHYFDAPGQGQLMPMVFLHGLGAHAAELFPTFHRLKRYTRRLIAVDLPIHGWSGTPRDGIRPPELHAMLFEALDQILDEPVLLFGNSLGGLAAIRYALHSPQNVGQLVLSSPGGASLPEEELEAVRQLFGRLTQHEPDRFVKLLYAKTPRYRWFAEKEVRLRFSRPALGELMSHIRSTELLRPEDLPAIQAPTLLIWGQQDRILENQLRFFKQHMPAHFKLIEPPHFGHAPYMEHERELAHLILSFARLHTPEKTLSRWPEHSA